MPSLASAALSPYQVEIDSSIRHYALKMLDRLIIADEFHMKRRSCFRIFVRMDISVFQCKGKFQYMVNELTSSQHTALFLDWAHGEMDYCIQDLSKTLHFATLQDLSERNGI